MIKKYKVIAGVLYCITLTVNAENSNVGFKNILLGDDYGKVSKNPLVTCGVPLDASSKIERHPSAEVRKMDQDVHAAYLRTLGDKVCKLKKGETIAGQLIEDSSLIFYGNDLQSITIVGLFPAKGFNSQGYKEQQRLISALVDGLTEKYGAATFVKEVKPKDYKGMRSDLKTLSYAWTVNGEKVLVEHTEYGDKVHVSYTKNTYDKERLDRAAKHQALVKQREVFIEQMKDKDTQSRKGDI